LKFEGVQGLKGVCVQNLAKCSNSGVQEVVMHVCFVIDLAVLASGFLKMQLLVLSREQRKCECINFDV
jgi:hypothetical protein